MAAIDRRVLPLVTGGGLVAGRPTLSSGSGRMGVVQPVSPTTTMPAMPGSWGPVSSRPPSGVTGIVAVTLAYLGAGASILQLFTTSVEDRDMDHGALPSWFGWLIVAWAVVVAALLAGGATMMLRRRPVGRIVVAVACVLALIGAVLQMIPYALISKDVIGQPQTPQGVDDLPDLGGLVVLVTGAAIVALLVVLVVIPALITAILALVPPTKRWILRDRTA